MRTKTLPGLLWKWSTWRPALIGHPGHLTCSAFLEGDPADPAILGRKMVTCPRGQQPSSAVVRGPWHATLNNDEMLVSKRTEPLGAPNLEISGCCVSRVCNAACRLLRIYPTGQDALVLLLSLGLKFTRPFRAPGDPESRLGRPGALTAVARGCGGSSFPASWSPLSRCWAQCWAQPTKVNQPFSPQR